MEININFISIYFLFFKIQRVLRRVKYKQAARSAYDCIRSKYSAGNLVCFGVYM